MALTDSALTTLATLKDELGITTSTEDTRLERYITQASAMIANFFGRAIHYNRVTQRVPGQGGSILVVDRTPIWTISSIELDGDALETTDYEIQDKHAGLIFNEGGWAWTAERGSGVDQPLLAGTERNLYEVDFTAGWFTPEQTHLSRNIESIDTAASLTPDSLPSEIEYACIRLAVSLRGARKRDSAIASESLMSYGVTYKADAGGSAEDAGIPSDIANMIRPYRFLAQSDSGERPVEGTPTY